MTDPRDQLPAADDLAIETTGANSLPLDRHPVFVLLASRGSEHSRRSYASTLDKLARMIGRWTGREFTKENLPWWLLRYPHVVRIKAELAEEHTPASANVRISHLRSLLER